MLPKNLSFIHVSKLPTTSYGAVASRGASASGVGGITSVFPNRGGVLRVMNSMVDGSLSAACRRARKYVSIGSFGFFILAHLAEPALLELALLQSQK